MKYHGQKLQDQWIIEEVFPGKRDGWFLDLAASGGVMGNNTVVLERALGWNGLAIEPNPASFDALRQVRTCQVAQLCIDADHGTVEFLANGGLGGIVDDDTDNTPLLRADLIERWRADGRTMSLQAEPLASVLDRYGAPNVIDYFSFDVEGAETRILRTFPFNRYCFLSATIERPTPELNDCLFANGYLFVRNNQFDSYYVHETLPGLDRVAREPFEQVPLKDW